MQRFVLILVLMTSTFSLRPAAFAQSDSTVPSRGSNLDPPPPPRPKETRPPSPEEAPSGEPFFQLDKIDWNDKKTWVKLGLLVGSIILARRAFRDMKGDEEE